ncbi:hypothetical protein ACQ4PT_043617 [Festuca glaucescens]
MAASEHLLGRPTGSSLGMVMASTGVAVMGSFAFGVAIGYSAPTEAGITQDLQLSLSQAKVGRQKEFEIALQRLRGNNADVFLEAEEIKIFPINMKGIGGSFVTLVNWSSSLAVSFAFNFLMSWSSSGTFFFFAFVCAMAILFIVKIVPETKGKTLEEIQASINCRT